MLIGRAKEEGKDKLNKELIFLINPKIWKKRNLSRKDSLFWFLNHFDPEEAEEWNLFGFSYSEAVYFRTLNMNPFQSRAFIIEKYNSRSFWV